MLVARGLLEGSRSGKSYRLALEGLHLVDGKPAHFWKDYYLEHTHRINHLVMRLQDPNTKTLKKPSLDSFMPMKQEHRNGMPRWDPRDPRDPYQGRSSSDPYSREGSASARSTTGGTSSALGRRTQNSLSTPSAMYSEKMPPPNAEIQIPQAPSRSPTPPRRVEAKGGTHMYTPEDKEYFLRFISWRLKRNPNLTRAELCDQLAQKAPQHSASSWGYHWQRTHDVADKILQAAHGGELPKAPARKSRHGDDEDSDEEVITRTTKSRRALKGNVKAESTPPSSPPVVQSKIKIPEPPSRSPSPPAIVPNPSNRPARYTQADDDYLIKFVGWRLKGDPNLTRQEICDKLARKMPNHSANAWLSRWRKFNDGLPDAIYDGMHVEREEDPEDDGEEDEDDDENGAGSDTSSLTEESEMSDYKSRPKTRGSATSRRGRPAVRRNVVVDDEEADAEGSDDEPNGNQAQETTISEDEKLMGESGEPFTDADMRIAARYVASQPNWAKMTSKARWEGFIARYPGRSYKSWSEYYRRMDKKIDKLAKSYKKRQSYGETSPAQTSPVQPPPATPEDRFKESRMSEMFEREASASTEFAVMAPPESAYSATTIGSETFSMGTRTETLTSVVSFETQGLSADDAAPAKRKLDPDDDEGDQTPPQKMARMDVEEPTSAQTLM